jgi:hypothetical protein
MEGNELDVGLELTVGRGTVGDILRLGAAVGSSWQLQSMLKLKYPYQVLLFSPSCSYAKALCMVPSTRCPSI